jgi:hypothetical protein
MNITKRIGTVLVAFCVMAGFAQAASKEKPSATLQLNSGSVAVGIGYSWGSGTLTFKGKSYPVSVKGLSIGKVGISKATAAGKVYNLKKVSDFDGNYTAVGAGLAVAGGGGVASMSNQNGVRIDISATTRGLDLTIGGAGVDLKIKK